ncbi:GntR family transcriptional regulator [Pseudomonas sp. SWRI59]|uniref:GntR family transcriptional regulator n=1 Tax=Pseudomonas TaxID=286 RepID=UPI0016484A83|nr:MULTISPECIES: GntR family transcriptional regulator [unclassified Pseudomonas]MBC3503334.1 GntR family transcriptional regulator [Pseudomonas sp. SWRI59]MBC3508749.1 GntR family transcriptional regulator [Pseudomonas sp. SWRI68]UPL09140.1 Carbon starvation induced regulator [Pseudomonas sp. IsoF]
MQNQQGGSLIEVALQQMKKSIICCELAPGEKLKVAELSVSYGLSSSPIREALNRLAQEGIVEASENKGFRVARLSVDDFQQITQLRRLLECEALAEAIRHGDDAWEADVLGAFHRLKVVEKRLGSVSVALDDDWSERHKAFHFALFSACPSDMMLRLIDSLFDQAERYRRFSALHRSVERHKGDEHQQLIDAVLSRDINASVELLGNHIGGTLKHVTDVLRQQHSTLQ